MYLQLRAWLWRCPMGPGSMSLLLPSSWRSCRLWSCWADGSTRVTPLTLPPLLRCFLQFSVPLSPACHTHSYAARQSTRSLSALGVIRQRVQEIESFLCVGRSWARLVLRVRDHSLLSPLLSESPFAQKGFFFTIICILTETKKSSPSYFPLWNNPKVLMKRQLSFDRTFGLVLRPK